MKNQDFLSLRREYTAFKLDRSQAHPDPIQQFGLWFQQAVEAGLPEANAMTLATVSPQGQPSARVVLLKDYDLNGFVFFTNYASRKGSELEFNPRAALVFFWAELQRQVRLEGIISKISPEESDEYFMSRPREAQIGAIASAQSQVLPNRKYLEDLVDCLDDKFSNTSPSRPAHWGGYRLLPQRIEFWQGRLSRLNDRLEYTLEQGAWKINRLAP